MHRWGSKTVLRDLLTSFRNRDSTEVADDARERFVVEDLKRGQPEVRSFDVYDTLITRAVGSDRSMFYTLGARLREMGIVPFTPRWASS